MLLWSLTFDKTHPGSPRKKNIPDVHPSQANTETEFCYSRAFGIQVLLQQR